MVSQQPTRTFPDENTLCEACGYALRGLEPDQSCPECGRALRDSSPQLRTGPAFANHLGLRAYLRTAAGILLHSKKTYRTMRIDGTNKRARLFLLISILTAALAGVTAYALPLPGSLAGGWANRTDVLMGIALAGPAILVLTYIEVLGVAWFSQKRSWRVPPHLSERLACFASVGWLPGMVVLGVVMNLSRSGLLYELWWSIALTRDWAAECTWATTILAGVAAMLGFESLVWLGVRQMKFANA